MRPLTLARGIVLNLAVLRPWTTSLPLPPCSTFPPSQSPRANPTITNPLVERASLILLGIFVSYVPQHYRIIQRRSSEGISPYFVLLGSTAGSSAFANILLLSRTVADLRCCRVVSGFECLAGVLGVAQVGMQWLGFSVM